MPCLVREERHVLHKQVGNEKLSAVAKGCQGFAINCQSRAHRSLLLSKPLFPERRSDYIKRGKSGEQTDTILF